MTWGLGYAFEGVPLSREIHNKTPSGGAGILFADPKRQAEGSVKCDMDAQEWRKMPRPGQSDIYIGYWKDAPPTPEDLARKNQLGGYSIPLADDKRWNIPLVRMFDEAAGQLKSNLPCYIDLDESGKPVNGQPLAAYAHLWELTAPYAEQMMAEGEEAEDTTQEDIQNAARTILQVNYLVDWPELAVARVLTNQQMAHNVVAVAVDWPTYLKWREVSKKKTPSLVTAAG